MGGNRKEVRVTIWLILGAICLFVVVAAAVITYRVLSTRGDAELGEQEFDDTDSEWYAPAPRRSHTH